MSILLAHLGYNFDYQGAGSTSAITRYYGLNYNFLAPGAEVTNAKIYRVSSTRVRGRADFKTAVSIVTVCTTTTVSGRRAMTDGTC